MDLTEFLLARIAEDEAAASNNGTLAGDHWSALESEPGDISCDVVGRGRGVVVRALRWEAEHIARHDPAHVLAECDAKRRIVETVARNPNAPWDAYAIGRDDVGRSVLRLLALPYADHPDYDPAWRP